MNVIQQFTDKGHSAPTDKLIQAVMTDNYGMARKFIARGANVNVRGRKNNTLLHVVLSPQMAQILLHHGAKINAVNEDGQTPIQSSMRRNFSKLTNFFISKGSATNIAQKNGKTPLHIGQNPAIILDLLAYGADPNLQDSNGDTPLHVAARRKGYPITTALIQYGANRNIRNSDDKIPFELLGERIVGMNQQFAKMAEQLNPVQPSILEPQLTGLCKLMYLYDNFTSCKPDTNTASMPALDKPKLR